MNNNLNNDLFINPTKLFINKIWKENIIKNYDQGLNNLNTEFNENLTIKPKEVSDFDIGTSYDNYFNKEYFGIKRVLKKLHHYIISLMIILFSNIITKEFKENIDKIRFHYINIH